MNIILLEKVRSLGAIGDIVNVSPGYARNFLIPQRKAVFATTESIARVNAERAELEAKASSTLETAKLRAEIISKAKPVVKALASDEGKLYGSVVANDILNAMKTLGIDVKKREIVLANGPIHSIGEYDIEIHVHPDVIATIHLVVEQSA
jgi:large subunit ribosomal protein L9